MTAGARRGHATVVVAADRLHRRRSPAVRYWLCTCSDYPREVSVMSNPTPQPTPRGQFYRDLFKIADRQAADRAAAVALLRFALRLDQPKETPR